MKILRLFIFLFSKSFDFLKNYKENQDLEEFLKRKEILNFEINEFIFKNSKFFPYDNNNHQFFIDFTNDFFFHHLQNRLYIYSITKYFGKFSFITFSLVKTYILGFKKFLIGLNNSLKSFNQIEKSNFESKKIIACFGFPNHAFSIQEKFKYPSSFIEYLFLNKMINSNYEILSFDSYTRPSKKVMTSSDKFKFQNKIYYIAKTRKWSRLFNIGSIIINSIKEFNIKFHKKGILPYLYFFEKYSRKHLLNQIITSDLNIENYYFITPYDTGLLKYDDYNQKFNFYTYSQNEYIPPSDYVYSRIFDNNFNYDLNKVLKEVTINIFSMYQHNQINLTGHINFYNDNIMKIKDRYKINLLKPKNNLHEIAFSNLGYENLIKINLEKKQKNVIMFDLPIESLSSTLGRQFGGDVFAMEKLILNIYEDLIDIFSKHNVNIFLKPKYSISDTKNEKLYESILFNISKKVLNFKIIDPYDKIEVHNSKFDIAINMPYTSTFFTLSNLANKNIFYVPEEYYKYFKYLSKDFIVSKNELDKLIKQIK